MKLNRREFLKALGLTAGAWLLPSGAPLVVQAKDPTLRSSKGMLVDLTRCIGCGQCQEACKEWNDLPAEQTQNSARDDNQLSLSTKTWTLVEPRRVEDHDGQAQVWVKRQCMHCLYPACESACPVGALQRTEDGAVVYSSPRCIGCRYCMVACPLGIPKFEWEKPLPRIQKCTFCVDRQAAGLAPACALACPTGALLFGERADLIAQAEEHIQEQPDLYVHHIYGQEEFGGTSWLYLSPVTFEELGFPTSNPEPVTRLSETVATYGTPGLALSVTLLLGGVYHWCTRLEGTRIAEEPVRREERGEKS